MEEKAYENVLSVIVVILFITLLFSPFLQVLKAYIALSSPAFPPTTDQWGILG